MQLIRNPAAGAWPNSEQPNVYAAGAEDLLDLAVIQAVHASEQAAQHGAVIVQQFQGQIAQCVKLPP